MNESTHPEAPPGGKPLREPVGDCGRARLLLSLANDGAATPQHRAELAAHLPGCEPCRLAQTVDLAVGERLRERAALAIPVWSEGFAERTVALALREAREARGQNRMLFACAAAAALVAVTVQLATGAGPRFDTGALGTGQTASVQESTKLALIRVPQLQRGK